MQDDEPAARPGTVQLPGGVQRPGDLVADAGQLGGDAGQPVPAVQDLALGQRAVQNPGGAEHERRQRQPNGGSISMTSAPSTDTSCCCTPRRTTYNCPEPSCTSPACILIARSAQDEEELVGVGMDVPRYLVLGLHRAADVVVNGAAVRGGHRSSTSRRDTVKVRPRGWRVPLLLRGRDGPRPRGVQPVPHCVGTQIDQGWRGSVRGR